MTILILLLCTIEIDNFGDGNGKLLGEILDEGEELKVPIDQAGKKIISVSGTVNITLVEPTIGSSIRSNSTITVLFSPTPSHIKHRWDGSGNWNVTTGLSQISIIAPSTEGNHYITIQANDSQGEWTEKVWAFKVDDISIFFTLNSPEEYSVNNSGTTIDVIFDPTPVGILYAWDDDTYSSYPRNLPEGDGLHVYKIMAEDSEGVWYSVNYFFYTDDTAPGVILSEINDSTLASFSVVIWSNVPSDLDSILYNWDSNTNQTPTYFAPSDDYEFIIPSGSGWHDLYIYTNDSINNVASTHYRFKSKIRIGLSEHPYGIIKKDNNSIRGYIYCNSNITLPINFSDTPDTIFYNWWDNTTHKGENSTTLNRTQSSGQKILQIFANDSFGYWDNFTLIVNIDDVKPTIFAEWYGNESELVGNTSILFEYTETNIWKELYSWDGTANSSLPYLPTAIGIHTLKFYIQDWALNWNNYSYVYYAKYNVSLINTVNGSSLNGGYGIEVDINPIPSDTLYQWDSAIPSSSLNSVPTTSAWHTLNISTQDTNGKWYHDIFLFQTILNVSIITPKENYLWQSVPVQLQFSETPLTTLYAWDNETTYSTFIHDTPTTDGDHWLHVQVENSDLPATSWFTYSFHIIIDNTNPSLDTVIVENNSRINKATELKFSFLENCTVRTRWDSNAWGSLLGGNTSSEIILGTSENLTDGDHEFFLNMTDLANNTSILRMVYIIDNTPINIDLNSPSNGSTITSNTQINITFSEIPVTKYFYIENYSANNETTIPQIPYNNVTITFHTYVSDGLNWNKSTFTFTVTHLLAQIRVYSPNNGSIIKKTTDFNVTFEGETTVILYQWGESENQTDLVIPDESEKYILTIWVQDISTKWIIKRYQFEVDNTPPSILNTIPSVEVIAEHTITFNCSEMISGLIFKWDSEENFTTIQYNSTTEFTLKAPPKSGNRSLDLQLRDRLGNEGEYKFYFLVKKSMVQVQRELLLLGMGTILVTGSAGVLIASIVIAYRKGLFIQG